MLDDYPGLVRKHCLQPNTAYGKQKVWEQALFSKLTNAEAVAMRKEKK
jgi:hypothetical protein